MDARSLPDFFSEPNKTPSDLKINSRKIETLAKTTYFAPPMIDSIPSSVREDFETLPKIRLPKPIKTFKDPESLLNFLKSDNYYMKKFIKSCRKRKYFSSVVFHVVFEVVKDTVKQLELMTEKVCSSYHFLKEAIDRNRPDVVRYFIANPNKTLKEHNYMDRLENFEILKIIHRIYPKDIKSRLSRLLAKSFCSERFEMFRFLIETYGKFSFFQESVRDAFLKPHNLCFYAASKLFENSLKCMKGLCEWTVRTSDQRVLDLFKSEYLLSKINFLSEDIDVIFVRNNFEQFGIENFQKKFAPKICQMTLISAFFPPFRKEMSKFSKRNSSLQIYQDKVFNLKNMNRLLPYVLPDSSGKTIDGRTSMFSILEAQKVIECFKHCAKPDKIRYDSNTRIWTI